MSEDQPSEPPKKRKCDKCNRKINTSRFEIHYAKCEPKRKGKAAKEPIEAILKQYLEEKVEVKKQEEVMGDTFPCYLCGFEMKISELDSHPLRCTNREVSCWFCYVKYPVSIMANHEEVCPRRLRMEADNRALAPVPVPPKPPVAIEAPVVPPKPAENVPVLPKPAESHMPKPIESVSSLPLKPAKSVYSIPPKPAENIFSNPPKPVEPAQVPPKAQFKHVSIRPIEHPSVHPKLASIPSKPPFNSHPSLLKHSAPQKPIPRPPTVSSVARNVESKPNKSVPKSQARPNDEYRRNIAANYKEKEKIPQMKVEKEVKPQISQKENIVRPAEVKVGIEKANSTQPTTVLSSTNSSINAIKNSNASINANTNTSTSTNSSISANTNPYARTGYSTSSANTSAASTSNTLSQAADIAMELPRRLGEISRIMREEVSTIQRINRLIQENANRRKTSKQTGLNPSLIQLIPEKRYVFNFEDMECSICCIEFQASDRLKDLRCKHNYHSKCISQWLKINRSCPLCKTDLSVNIPAFVEEKPVPPSKETFASFIHA